MNNCLKKAVTLTTAAVMLASAVSLDFVRPLQAADPAMKARKLAPLPAQALEFTSADAGEAGLERLGLAMAAEDSSEVSAVCDTLSALLKSELAEQNVMTEPSDDPVIEARRQQYRNEIAVKAARTESALDALRAGTADESDLETIRDAFEERTASHRSDATPSIAADIPDAETEEGTLSTAAAQQPATDPPTGDEMLQSSETQLPQAVTDLAKELGSAKEIYRYVKEKVGYEAYAGSKKGAAVTLDQLGGNDIDQARLLIAMLRTIGIPARFVSGTVEITAEQAVSVTGAADAESAGRILEARHKGVKGVTDQGALVGYRMEQTWVEAYVPYTDYRGAGAAKGRSVWVPLDASFKALETEKQTLALDYTDNEKAILSRMDQLAADQPLIYSDYQRMSDSSDVYLRRIAQADDGYLPASLPYTVLAVSGRYAVLPDEMKDSLTVAVNGEELFSAPLTDLYCRQITVSYVPATDADKKLLENDTKLTEVPAYLVQMLPVVTVRGDNGISRYTGTKSAALGAMQQMTTTLKNEGDTTILTDDIFSGSVYAFNLDYQTIMPADINYSYGLLCAAKENAKEDNYTSPEVLGATLDYAGKSYFAYCDEEALKYETVFNVCRNRQLGLCITGYEFKNHDTLGVVDKLEDGSFFIDVAYNKYSAVSYAGDHKAETGFNTALGQSESYYEGKIWEIVTDGNLRGVSTVSVMNAAQEQNIPIRLVCAANAEESLAECHVSESVKDEVRDFVNKGMMVELVADTVTIGDWTGTAYIARDMKTGAASYMLSGGTAGGCSASFDRLYMINVVMFQITMSVSAVKLCETFVKIHMPSPGTVVDGVMVGLSTAKVMGEAFKMYYDNMFFIFDYAERGDDMMDEYLEFTKENIQRTKDYLVDCIHGAFSDIVGGALDLCKAAWPMLEDAFDFAGDAFDAMNEAGSTGKELGELYGDAIVHSDLTGDEYDEWFQEYNRNCMEKAFDAIMKLLSAFAG